MTEASDQRRLVARRALAYVVEAARLITAIIDADLVTALTFLAISRANVRRITADRRMAESYAGAKDIPPDALRTAVSVYSIAIELGLPYETVRRHAAKLRSAGLVERLDRGLVIPLSTYAQPRFVAALGPNERLTDGLLRDLEAFGTAAGQAEDGVAEDMSRQTLRLSIEFFLDVIAACSRALEIDHLDVVILLAIGLHNVGSAVISGEEAQAYAGLRDVPPDEARRPVSTYLVARYLPLPLESARRRCARLVQRGLVARSSEGMIVPAAVSTSPALIDAFALIAELTDQHVRRLADARSALAARPAVRHLS